MRTIHKEIDYGTSMIYIYIYIYIYVHISSCDVSCENMNTIYNHVFSVVCLGVWLDIVSYPGGGHFPDAHASAGAADTGAVFRRLS